MQLPVTATSTNLETVTMETLASKTMLKKKFKEKELEIKRKMIIRKENCATYSEAMLISGASKQISCAILSLENL